MQIRSLPEEERPLEKLMSKGASSLSNAELLETVHQHFVDTKDETYTLPAEKTLSGQPETYAFRCDKIGACGADTGFMYF